MSATHTTNACPACGAPTVHGRAECWSCGSPLTPVAAPGTSIPPPESYTRPCPKCGGACADYLSHCPSCAAPLGRASALVDRASALLDAVLGRSRPERLPDGTIRIRRDPTPRRTRLVLGPIIVAVMAYAAFYYLTAPQFHKMARDMEQARIEFVLLGLAAVTCIAVRAMFCDVVWDVSPNRLVVWTTFFWKRWKQQYTSATLHLETYNDVRGGRSTRLKVHAAEGHTTLHRVRRIRLWGNGGIRALAAHLAQITGWPLRDESEDWP